MCSRSSNDNKIINRCGENNQWKQVTHNWLDYNYFDGAYNANNDGDAGGDFFARRIRTYVESEHGNWDHKLLL